MKKLVLESSVILKWLNQKHEQSVSQVDKILDDAHGGKVSLYSPEIAKYEISSILLDNKKLTQTESKIPLTLLFHLPIEFIPQSVDVAKRSYVIAQAYSLSINEASFIALAEEKKAALVTENVREGLSDLELEIFALEDY